MEIPDTVVPSLEDIGRGHRTLQEGELLARKAKALPGDPGSDVGRLETDQSSGGGGGGGGGGVEEALESAKEAGRQLKTRVILANDPRVTSAAGDPTDPRPADTTKDQGRGLLSAAAQAVSSVIGSFSDSVKTGVDSVSGAVSAPRDRTPSGPEGHNRGGSDGLRVRDMLGSSDSDTPYPGDMMDEPVQLDRDNQGTAIGKVVGGLTPHIEVSEQRRRDPDVVTPLEGGPATTIRDSGVMVNTGPTAGGGARAQGFGFGVGEEGSGGGADTPGLLGLVREALATVTGAHAAEGSSLGGMQPGVVTRRSREEEEAQLAELRERMEGMPGSMPIDKEIRERREAEAAERTAALAAQREAVSSAARENIIQRHPETAERLGLHQHTVLREAHGAAEQAAERESGTAAAAAAAAKERGDGGGGGGLLTSLAHTLGNALGLGGGGGGGRVSGMVSEEQQQHEQLERRPVPVGTSPLEAKPFDKTAIGVPAAAEADAERGSASINTKESGREVPAGALGATVTDPAQHNPSFAPDFNRPNFFSEVEKRGLSDVLAAGAASLRDSAEHSLEEIRHGGGPAPAATTSGAIADTKDIARNVERVEHLDDPVQRRIYEAEVVRVAPGREAAADRRTEVEAVKEATSAMVLGKDRQVSGAKPHDVPEAVHPAPPVKQQAGGQSIFGSFGTGSASPPGGRDVKDAYDEFHAARTSWQAARTSPTRLSSGQGIREEDEQLRNQNQAQYSGGGSGAGGVGRGGDAALAAARRSGLAAWVARVGAAFTAKAASGDEGSSEGQQAPPGEEPPYNSSPGDPAGYAESKIHSGTPAGTGFKEPSGKEVKDAQYLKVYQEPHSKIMHIQGANFNWDRNKDREAGQTTTATDNPTLFDTAGRAIHKALTGEHHEGVPPMGGDTPGGQSNPFIQAKENLQSKVEKAPEIAADVASRTEESVVGVLEHLSGVAEAAASGVVQLVRSGLGDHKAMEERMAEAARRQEEREIVYEQDPVPGPAPSVAVHQRRLDQMDQEVDPALRRDTLVDKLLYPWSKDASTDDSNARAKARSYNEYVREKEAKGEPYDPLGAMAHDREYDTAKLPATVQQVERSTVDITTGERSGNNQEFLRQRAPLAGQAPLPEGTKAAIRSLAEDSAAHGRPAPAGLEGLRGRVEEEERGGVVRGALRARGTGGEDQAAYRDPHSDQAWHAAAVLQANIDRSAAAEAQRQEQEQEQGEKQTREGGMPGTGAGAGAVDGAGGGTVREAAGSVYAAGRDAGEGVRGAVDQAAGTVRGAAAAAGQGVNRVAGAASGAAEVAGEEARRISGGAVGAVRGAAEVAGAEVNRAAGAAGGATQVAGEEVSRAAGGLWGTIRQGLRELVGGSGGSKGSSERQEEEEPQLVSQPPGAGYSTAPRAVADLYQHQHHGSSAADRAMESVQAGVEGMAGRAKDAERVVGSAAEQAAGSAIEAAEGATEEVREGAGGLLGALRGLFIGKDQQQQRGREGGVADLSSRKEEEEEKEKEKEEEMGGKSGASHVAPGVRTDEVSEGLGRVAGSIVGALGKVLGGDGGSGVEGERGEAAAPAGPDAPVVPYTSTAEILAARRQEQEQH